MTWRSPVSQDPRKVDLGVSVDGAWCVVGWLDGLIGIAWASIEGTRAEMVLLGHAIETRGKYSAKRCAVDATGERVALWSPRNHVGDPPTVSRADAARLARRIRDLEFPGGSDEVPL